MPRPEQPASTESTAERQHDAFERWLRTATASATLQADLLAVFNRTATETGRILQRHTAALAETWLQAVTGTGGKRSSVAAGADRWTTAGPSRAGGDVPTTNQDRARTEAEATVDEATRPHSHERRLETAHDSSGTSVAAATGTGETGQGERSESSRPASPTEDEASGRGSGLHRIGGLAPADAAQLRAADVHTVEQLATARANELAAEMGVDPRRARVWVFWARRVYNR